MYNHTVLLCLDKDIDAMFLAKIRQFEMAVRSSCAGVIGYQFSANEAMTKSGFNHVLFSSFESRDAFVQYDRSALHIEIKDFLRPYVKDLLVADGDLSPIAST